jgi:hypothetical protein
MAAIWSSSRAPDRPLSRKPLEAVVCLQVCKAHLDALALVSRLEEGLGLHFPPSQVTGILMEVARILRAPGLVQHLARSGQASQSRFAAR